MKKVPFILYLVAGFLITIAAIYGYHLYCQRIGLPPEMKQLYKNGMLVQIDDMEIKTEHDDEFILCRRHAGESATFYIKTDEGVVQKQGYLIALYSQTPFPVINLIIGLFLIIMALVVFLFRPQDLLDPLGRERAFSRGDSKGVHDGLPSMGERRPHHTLDPPKLSRRERHPAPRREVQEGRGHAWHRVEASRVKIESDLHRGHELVKYAERSVLPTAGCGEESPGDLPLHHDGPARKPLPLVEQPSQ